MLYHCFYGTIASMKWGLRSICEKILKNKGENKLVTFFKDVELFRDFTDEEILNFIESVPISTREYAPGEMVFHEGQGGVSVYFVFEGRVGIYKNYGETDEITLAHLHKGDFFGEISFLRETPRTATVVAMQPTVLLAISQRDIEEFMNNYPHIAYKILKNFAIKLSNDLEKSNKQMENYVKTIHSLSEEVEILKKELNSCKSKLKPSNSREKEE